MDPTDLMVRALQGVPEDVGDPNLQWRDPVPATANIVKGLGTGLVDTAKGAIESAGNYAQTGEYDPKPIVNAATMAMGGASPFAEAGAAGIFGGRLAHTADLDRLNYAQKMRIMGSTPGSIYGETGWWRGPDGKWRFEIPDTEAALNTNLLHHKAAKILDEEGIATKLPVRGAEYKALEGNFLRSVPELSTYNTRQVMQHPELYEAYPQFRDMPVLHGKEPGGAGYFRSKIRGGIEFPPAIELGDARLSEMRMNMLHELQHGVQEREGFARGTKYDPNAPNKAREYFKYSTEPGEIEARNVAMRSQLTPAELHQHRPWETGQWVGLNPMVADMDVLAKALRQYK